MDSKQKQKLAEDIFTKATELCSAILTPSHIRRPIVKIALELDQLINDLDKDDLPTL